MRVSACELEAPFFPFVVSGKYAPNAPLLHVHHTKEKPFFIPSTIVIQKWLFLIYETLLDTFEFYYIAERLEVKNGI